MESKQRKTARVGRQAPSFSATAYFKGAFKKISLEDYRNKYVVLFFYPLDFTFVCPTEIIQFSDKYAEFQKLNCEVLGCSVDSQFSHQQWSKQPRKEGGLGELNFPLIADLTKQISEDYDVLIEGGGIAYRGTFIISPTGIVRSININDTPVGRNVDEVLRLVEAFQYTDEHGEVCPASWKKGQKTMVTDHQNAKTQDYFKTEGDKK